MQIYHSFVILQYFRMFFSYFICKHIFLIIIQNITNKKTDFSPAINIKKQPLEVQYLLMVN
jgi:hypothetical protein